MTAQAAQQKFTAKIAALPVATLQDMAGKLMVDHRDGTEVVLSAVMNALEARMPEAKFIAFCEAL
jgi:hypothetical protein